MESLKELYRIGPGPSSSHTVAPMNACLMFKEECKEAFYFEADLFGSLALTGQGHATDRIIKETFEPRQCKVTFSPYRKENFPNGVVLRAFDEYNQELNKWTVYSLGGGAFEVEEVNLHLHDEVYPVDSMDAILDYCNKEKITLAEYVYRYEPKINDHLEKVLLQMLKTVRNGLENEGLLPGSLKIERVASKLYLQAQLTENKEQKNRLLLTAYAYAACEENASGHTCVTAPTMGASGIIAAIIYHYYMNLGYTRNQLMEALAVGGLFGNLVKKNATISGAVGGCQAEVGTACAMASALISYLNGNSNQCISYAAEIGIEHNLGLTCDPVGGYVIIPCIERNAVATLRAFDNAFIAEHVSAIKENRVSFDNVVKTMNYTGQKIAMELRETSLGGLATEIAIKEEKVEEPEVLKEEESVQLTIDEILNEESEEKVVIEETAEVYEEPVVLEEPAVEEEPVEESAVIEEPVEHQAVIEESIEEPVIETEPEAVIEEVIEEPVKEESVTEEVKEEYTLSDLDFALLESWNKKSFKEPEQKDAFNDKLDFLNKE